MAPVTMEAMVSLWLGCIIKTIKVSQVTSGHEPVFVPIPCCSSVP